MKDMEVSRAAKPEVIHRFGSDTRPTAHQTYTGWRAE